MNRFNKLLLVILGLVALTYISHQYSQYKYNQKIKTALIAVEPKQ